MQELQELNDRERGNLAEHWYWNPCDFCEDVLGFRPWDGEGTNYEGDTQADVMNAVPHHRDITTRSGHKVGKSRLVAAIALWAWTLLDDCQVILTAPVFSQVQRTLWREIRRLYLGSRVSLGAPKWCALQASTGLAHPDGNAIFGRAISEHEAFSGLSGKNMLYMLDEASGIPADIYEAIDGNLAGGGWVIQFGNPTQVSGQFFESHHEKAHIHQTFHINSESVARHINPHGNVPLASLPWLEKMRAKYGDVSSQYAVRVLGDFPSTGLDTVYTLQLIQRAMLRWRDYVPPVTRTRIPRLCIGIDVARFGDDKTVAIGRRNKWISRPLRIDNADGPTVASKVVRWVEDELKFSWEGKTPDTGDAEYVVDIIGVGASVYDALKMRGHNVRGLNSSHKARDDEKFHNVRAEIAFNTRAFLIDGGMLPLHPTLRSEMLAIRYKFDTAGRLQLEPKEETKKRLGFSPDHADALHMCCYPAVVTSFDGRPLKIGGLLG